MKKPKKKLKGHFTLQETALSGELWAVIYC